MSDWEVRMEVLGREIGLWVLRWVWRGGEEQERTMERESMGEWKEGRKARERG